MFADFRSGFQTAGNTHTVYDVDTNIKKKKEREERDIYLPTIEKYSSVLKLSTEYYSIIYHLTITIYTTRVVLAKSTAVNLREFFENNDLFHCLVPLKVAHNTRLFEVLSLSKSSASNLPSLSTFKIDSFP